jgi:hypothetical protein
MIPRFEFILAKMADFQLRPPKETSLGLRTNQVQGYLVYYEELALEVNATIAGLEVIKPPILRGKSGIEHRFAFLAVDGQTRYGFDVCPKVGEVEILRAFVKKMDTGIEAFVVCLSGRPEPEGEIMSAKYSIKVLSPGDVGDFFSKRISDKIRAPGRTRSK